MKVLASNESASNYSCQFSKVVEFPEIGKKFKITHKTGNCYSNTTIYVMLPDLSWAEVADGFDIGSEGINYVLDEDFKRQMMVDIYEKAIKYIKAVFI
jgi:hypothetical protein